MGSYGWCREDEDGQEECVRSSTIYLTSVHWALSLIFGIGAFPQEGPYPPTLRDPDDRGSLRHSDAEMAVQSVLMVVTAFGTLPAAPDAFAPAIADGSAARGSLAPVGGYEEAVGSTALNLLWS